MKTGMHSLYSCFSSDISSVTFHILLVLLVSFVLGEMAMAFASVPNLIVDTSDAETSPASMKPPRIAANETDSAFFTGEGWIGKKFNNSWLSLILSLGIFIVIFFFVGVLFGQIFGRASSVPILLTGVMTVIFLWGKSVSFIAIFAYLYILLTVAVAFKVASDYA